MMFWSWFCCKPGKFIRCKDAAKKVTVFEKPKTIHGVGLTQGKAHRSSEWWYAHQTSRISWITASGKAALRVCVQEPQNIRIWQCASLTRDG